MLNSWIAITLMVIGLFSNDPLYYIAAGTFEIAGVIYDCFKPRRLK